MLDGLDLTSFVAALGGVMLLGLAAGRRTTSDPDEFFLAGRSLPWWAVAGSIFGTNVSAHHMVGMLGIGFSIGFAQSHYELGAVFALLALAYVLVPVYARLRVYTLSEYLGARYGEATALAYSGTTVLLIVLQLAALFYIGSRSLNLLLRDSPLELGYVGMIAALALLTSAYTIVGGLRAVAWTDVIQAGLLLAAGILVALLTFAQEEIGGISGLLAADAALPRAEQRMRLYLPAHHPDLPWTGVFTGLIALHLSFWGTNQYIVQRVLAARSPTDARVGILVGGWLKLLVPFFSIAGGVAAARLLATRADVGSVAPDEAFAVLIEQVVPAGLGLVGLVCAGLMGAILSTIDSMMNSAATLVAVDVYRKHVRPGATDRELVRVGRIAIGAIVVSAALMAATTYDPESRGNFFLGVSRQISYLTPGLLVAFLMGIFTTRASSRGALAAIAIAPVFGAGAEIAWAALAPGTALGRVFGDELAFLHRTFLTVLACVAVHAVLARPEGADPGSADPVARPGALRPLARALALYLGGNALLAGAAGRGWLEASSAGVLAAALCLGLFAARALRAPRAPGGIRALARDDRMLAGALAAVTTWLLYAFA